MTTPHSDDGSMRLSGSMPDINSKPPRAVWNAGDYILVLTEHLDMIAKSMGYDGPTLIDYEATLAVVHREAGIKMLINLESTDSTRCFCAFTMDGDHENYGGATDMTVEAFTQRAFEMFRKRFDFSGTITQL
jgi:hypothetical protein